MIDMDILIKKRFPLNFPDDALHIIHTLAFDDSTIELSGSQSLRSQLYPADYDLLEEVKSNLKHDGLALQKFVLQFQEKIKYLTKIDNVYIADIKAGLLPEFEVIPDESYIEGSTIHNFSLDDSLEKLDYVYESKGVPKDEYTDLKQRLKSLNADTFLALKKDFRFHIVRWTPSDVERGVVETPIGPMSLQYAFCCPTIIKVDLIVYLESAQKYMEFSCIYQFSNGRKVFNRFKMEPEKDIPQDIRLLEQQDKWFKLAKRLFSVAAEKEWFLDLRTLSQILNSDLGILYSLTSDAETILFLLENEERMPVSKIRNTLEGFRQRLGNIYNIKANQPSILRDILRMEHLPATNDGRLKLYDDMVRLIEFFSVLLNKHAEEALRKNGLLPVPPKYLKG